jgi:hypothetical protein
MTSPFHVTEVEVEPQSLMSRLAASRAGPSIVVLSSPMKVDLAVYRGDTGQFRITVSDPNGNPVDITGYTWDGDIRSKANDPTVITNFTITPVSGDPASIDVALSLASADLLVPGTLVYDIEMRKPNIVMTLIYGNITVTQDVSRPT